MQTKRMPCADEGMAGREFAQIDDSGDHTCMTCGWMQRSAAAGAAELCVSALWHDAGEYRRYAEVARAGGYTVPDSPPRLDVDRGEVACV